MVFLGIDPSLTNSGLMLIDADYKIIASIELSTPSMGVERLYHLESKLLEFLEHCTSIGGGINLICIEGPALRESGRLFDLGGWTNLIYLTLFKRGASFIIAAPLQLKKYVSGFGKNFGKELVILDVFKNFGEEIRSNDLADAYVLARIAHDYYGKYVIDSLATQLKQHQVEVLAKMRKAELNDTKRALL